jgi:hypothetical protein
MPTSDFIPVNVFACALWPDASQTADAHSARPWQQALRALEHHTVLQQLARADLQVLTRLPADSGCSSHEWAYARAAGWPENTHLLPFAAHAAQQLQLMCPPDHGWAFIDLVHAQFSQGQVPIALPGMLSAAESEGFMQAMRPYFEEDGIHLQALSPGRFLAHAAVFKQLPAVSLDHVLQHGAHALADLDPVATQSPAQRLLRRLQNEMQMLFYTHTLNAQRDIPVNSFWLSGSGELPAPVGPEVKMHTGLRDSFLANDPMAWAEHWVKLAEQTMLPALQQGQALILCGPQRCLQLQAEKSNWLQTLKHRFFQPSLTGVLS